MINRTSLWIYVVKLVIYVKLLRKHLEDIYIIITHCYFIYGVTYTGVIDTRLGQHSFTLFFVFAL